MAAKTTKVTNQEDVLRALLDVEDTPEKDVFMKRFNVHFRIRAIDGKVINRIREQATYPTKNGKELDEEKFGALIIQKACVVPNWADSQLLDKYGTHDPSDVIQKRLLAGEIAKLTTEIMDISGFADDKEEELKN
ncbi:phage tail assembly chaperone [Fredinandcohnia humi]